MKVEQWQLTQLRPYEHNPRLNDEAVDVVAASIREFGFRPPIVVEDNKGVRNRFALQLACNSLVARL